MFSRASKGGLIRVGAKSCWVKKLSVGAALLLTSLLVVPSSGARSDLRPARDAADIKLVGAFFVGTPISGAVQHDGFLYVTTSDRLSIYNIEDPASPVLEKTVLSPRLIYGELLSTNGETLLLNNGLEGNTLDIWDVEDKTNPVLSAALKGVTDEHVSCLLDCTWAYGSSGSIIDLRRQTEPVLRTENWMERAGMPVFGPQGFPVSVHRVDEFRHGFMATAPRGPAPDILDVRSPLHPKVIARGVHPPMGQSAYLFTGWPRDGRDRYVISSMEVGECDEDGYRGPLVTFDTRGWPQKQRFPVADTYRYKARTDTEERGCTAYYYSLNPSFEDGGLLILPSGLEGVRMVDVDDRGRMEEVDAFVPVVSDVWLAFWANEEIFYALNRTGEVYVLSYN